MNELFKITFSSGSSASSSAKGFFFIGFVMPDNCSYGCLFAGLQLKCGKLASWIAEFWLRNLLCIRKLGLVLCNCGLRDGRHYYCRLTMLHECNW